ncbi:MAG: hypothetical protein OXF44_07735 [Anaerolineaceae bacterium]|nr:hypothetical protein [Anaerolineaceae bacterium]
MSEIVTINRVRQKSALRVGASVGLVLGGATGIVNSSGYLSRVVDTLFRWHPDSGDMPYYLNLDFFLLIGFVAILGALVGGALALISAWAYNFTCGKSRGLQLEVTFLHNKEVS